MTALPADAREALEALTRALGEHFGGRVGVYVFGSYAQGEQTPASDLDVLLIAPPELRRAVRERAAEVVSRLQIGGAPPMSFVLIDPERWQQPSPFIREVQRDAVGISAL